VRGRIDVEDEPRSRTDCGPDAECLVLPADERLEVIVDDRLIDRRNALSAPRMKEDGVPAKTLGHASHGSLGAMIRSTDLTVCRARRQPRRHGDEQLRALRVIRRRKRLA
jgi:hypothetical protein